MNETRKKIIELISPYMNNTLANGCIVEIQIQIQNFWRILYYDDLVMECLYYDYEKGNWVCLTVKNKIFKFSGANCIRRIIGHYDITAATKYIIEKGYYSSNYSKNIIEFTNKHSEECNVEFSIPNKPLHLYTEEEEKKLYNILISLQ